MFLILDNGNFQNYILLKFKIEKYKFGAKDVLYFRIPFNILYFENVKHFETQILI